MIKTMRWSVAFNRKEWWERGRALLIAGGGGPVGDPLVVTLTASPSPAFTSSAVSLTAAAAGGTGPYVYAFTASGGVTLTGAGSSRSFTAPGAATSLTLTVQVTDSVGAGASAAIVLVVQQAASTQVLFAGHVPNRVLVGMATPAEGSNATPGWVEARQLIGQPIYEARRFDSGSYSAAALSAMFAEADTASAYPVLSFKTPSNDWVAVANGGSDVDLLAIYNKAVGRRASGPGGSPQPFAMGFHHEPAGDGPLGEWAAMQLYCCYYFAGRRGGTAGSTYVAAHDVRDIMAWCTIGNGFWWRTTANPAAGADANVAYPQTLIDALRINKGILMADTYDVDYVDQTGALTNESLRTPGSGVRTSVRIDNMLTWGRNKNCGAMGLGEFGVIDDSQMTACWQVIRANRDIMAVVNYFNSQNNSDHEWRVIPADYPAGNPTGSKGLVDFGGNAQSAGRLAAFKTMLTESTSVAYTSPIG